MTRNVLFITVDQWRGDCLSSLGHPVVTTPALDRLAAQGTLFANHWANAAPCGPSRACLYTGTYLHHNRSLLNGTPLDARFTNVALLARQAGYDPVLFGYTDTSLDPRTLPADDPTAPLLRAGAARVPCRGVRPVGGGKPGLGPVAGRAGRGRPHRPQRTVPTPARLPGGRRSRVDVGAHPVQRRAVPDGLPDRIGHRVAGPERGRAVLRARLLPPAPSAAAQSGRLPRPLRRRRPPPFVAAPTKAEEAAAHPFNAVVMGLPRRRRTRGRAGATPDAGHLLRGQREVDDQLARLFAYLDDVRAWPTRRWWC